MTKKDERQSMKLLQDVLRGLNMSKPPKANLTLKQRKALKESKTHNDICIYSYDKGTGIVRISKNNAI